MKVAVILEIDVGSEYELKDNLQYVRDKLDLEAIRCGKVKLFGVFNNNLLKLIVDNQAIIETHINSLPAPDDLIEICYSGYLWSKTEQKLYSNKKKKMLSVMRRYIDRHHEYGGYFYKVSENGSIHYVGATYLENL